MSDLIVQVVENPVTVQVIVGQVLSGGGVSDGDKGDITVSGSGAVWTIDPGVVTLSKLADLATSTILGRSTAGTGSPEALSAAQVRAILNVADGSTANASDASLRDRATHTGTQLAATISDFAAAVAATAAVTANTAKVSNATHTGDVTGDTALTIANLAVTSAKIADDAVGNDKLANMAFGTIKARTTAGSGNPENATGTEVTALLDTFTSGAKGLAPASGGGTANFLRADGSWATPAGGGGSPGGSPGEVQFNDAGAFGGAGNVQIEGGNLKLMPASDPSPPTDGLVVYSKLIAGRQMPKVIGPAGLDTVLQASLGGNSAVLVSPTSGTAAPSIVGGTLTTVATMSLQFTAGSTNRWFATARKRFQTTTTAGNASGMRTSYGQWFRGSAAGFGGFIFRAQFGAQINLNGGQKFIGLAQTTSALGGDPSALLNMCGVGHDAADPSTGNWQFLRNDGSGAATKVDLGADVARGTTEGFELIMVMNPGDDELFVRVTNLNTGVVALDTSYTTDLPTANIAMCLHAQVRNGAVAAADNIEVAKMYLETDY